MLDAVSRDFLLLFEQWNIRLLNPSGLWLLIAGLLFVGVGLFMGEDISTWRKWTMQTVRLFLIATLAIAYAQPVQTVESHSPAVVVLADLSKSISTAAHQKLRDRLHDVWQARGDAPVYVVGFAKSPELLYGPRDRRLGPLLLRSPDDAKGTDIASALRFAYGLFPQKYDRRVLILSDGEQTTGNLLTESKRAKEFGVQVWAAPIVPHDEFDVRLESIEAPDSVRINDRFEISVGLQANKPKQVRLILSSEGKRTLSRRLSLAKGFNSYTFETYASAEGFQAFWAKVVHQHDRFVQNNQLAKKIYVFGKPRVLLVRQNVQPNPLGELLEKQAISLFAVSSNDLDMKLSELVRFDLVVLDDLKLTKLPDEFVVQLQSFVEDYAGGLLVTAGSDAAELAEPKEYAIEPLLPVELRKVKKKERIPAALVFVTDRSSSMGRGDKFVILLRAVADTLARLDDSVQVSVIMFDDFPEVVVPLTEAKNRKQITDAILAQRVGGGTSIYPALREAHLQLKKSAAKRKHVILLSDGQSISMYGHYGHVVEKMARDGITITSVGVGEDADQAELKQISLRSSGRYYYTASMDNVPQIFSTETQNIVETNIVEKKVRPVVTKLVQVFSGVDFKKAPEIGGYIASDKRPTSEVLLVSSDRGEPLLARWRFGLGQVVVWTTDAQGRWSQEWPAWDGFSTLWTQLVDDSLRKTLPADLRLMTRVEGDKGFVTLRIPTAQALHEPSWSPVLQVQSPAGKRFQLPMKQRGLAVYQTQIQLAEQGPYALRIERVSQAKVVEQAFASISKTFEDEFLSSAGDQQVLQKASQLAAGGLDPTPQQLFAPGLQKREQLHALWPGLLLLAMGLFLIEILIRRL